MKEKKTVIFNILKLKEKLSSKKSKLQESSSFKVKIKKVLNKRVQEAIKEETRTKPDFINNENTGLDKKSFSFEITLEKINNSKQNNEKGVFTMKKHTNNEKKVIIERKPIVWNKLLDERSQSYRRKDDFIDKNKKLEEFIRKNEDFKLKEAVKLTINNSGSGLRVKSLFNSINEEKNLKLWSKSRDFSNEMLKKSRCSYNSQDLEGYRQFLKKKLVKKDIKIEKIEENKRTSMNNKCEIEESPYFLKESYSLFKGKIEKRKKFNEKLFNSHSIIRNNSKK